MPVANANGIELCYETFGDPADPALLLVMGFTAQLTAWDEAFCRALAERGRFVIRFDNRDCGLSTHLDGVEVDLAAVLVAAGDEMPPVPYTLATFADDAFGLLDHLDIERAHVLGASMGGMIVQTMAIDQPTRVLSMTSVMSNTGEPEYSTADPRALEVLMTPPPLDRDAFIPFSVERGAVFSSPRYYDRSAAAARAAASYDRAFYPEGAGRQLAAIRASGHRADGLRQLGVSTLVIHGRADPLILPVGGERTAELVPGANLLMVADMGHDLPEPLWPLLVDSIISHTTHCIGGAG
ncbi:MAG: alpha/beta fold hydrolase [Acidimicrobiales bacterium]